MGPIRHCFKAYVKMFDAFFHDPTPVCRAYAPFFERLGIREALAGGEEHFIAWQSPLTYEHIAECLHGAKLEASTISVFSTAPVGAGRASNRVTAHGTRQFTCNLQDSNGRKVTPEAAWDAFRTENPAAAVRLCALLDPTYKFSTIGKTKLSLAKLAFGWAARGVLNEGECDLFSSGRMRNCPLQATLLDLANSIYFPRREHRKPNMVDLWSDIYPQDHTLAVVNSVLAGLPVCANFDAVNGQSTRFDDAYCFGYIIGIRYNENGELDAAQSFDDVEYNAFPADAMWKAAEEEDDSREETPRYDAIHDGIFYSRDGDQKFEMTLDKTEWGAPFIRGAHGVSSFCSRERCRFSCVIAFQNGVTVTMPAVHALMLVMAATEIVDTLAPTYHNTVRIEVRPSIFIEISREYGVYGTAKDGDLSIATIGRARHGNHGRGASARI